MPEGKRAEARRGELGMQAPMGHCRQLSGIVVKDPDEQAQSVIERAFELFERKRTINGVLSRARSAANSDALSNGRWHQ
jgi:hypothetical protein